MSDSPTHTVIPEADANLLVACDGPISDFSGARIATTGSVSSSTALVARSPSAAADVVAPKSCHADASGRLLAGDYLDGFIYSSTKECRHLRPGSLEPRHGFSGAKKR